MSATDASVFPVKGQAFRITGKIVNATTGNPITGGLTTLTSTVSKDGAAFASTTSAAAEIGTTGYFYVDLSSTEMNANTVTVHVTAANSDAVYFSACIFPADMSEPSGHARDATVLRLEQLLVQVHMYFFNKVLRAIGTGTVSLYDYGASAIKSTFARLTGADYIGKDEG